MNSLKHESGAVLIIALIFILIMSVIGLTAIQSTTVQERMALNNHDRNLAFQAAEAALRNAENTIMGGNINTVAAGLSIVESPNWAGWANATAVNLNEPTLAQNPVYVIHEPISQRSNISSDNPTFRELYPITATASGQSVVDNSNFAPTNVALRSFFLR